jgi:hypothetical protein
MVTREGNGAEDRMANIDHEGRAILGAKYLEICDVETNILPGDG